MSYAKDMILNDTPHGLDWFKGTALTLLLVACFMLVGALS